MHPENIHTQHVDTAGQEPLHSLSKVCEIVWNVERTHRLLELELDGVKCWQSGRMRLFYQLCETAGLYERPHDKVAGLAKTFRQLWNTVAHNPFLTPRGADVLVVPHERTKRVGGDLADIYSADYVDALKTTGKRVVVLERATTFGHLDAPRGGGNPRTDALSLLNALCRTVVPSPFISEEKAARIEAVENELDTIFGIRFELKTRLVQETRRFKAHFRSWRRLLLHLQPKEVVVVVGYGLTPLIGAAKDMGIPVTEIQHGVIGRYHMGYSYPDLDRPLAYFPDRFLSWGPYWTKNVHFPLPESAIEYIGFSYFRTARMSYQQVEKVPKRIVVISQGTIGPALADLLWRNRGALESYDVHYKLHPGEYKRWRSYEGLVALSALPNVEILQAADLYRLMAEAEFQIGVYSTALYEGIAFGCRTVLCDLPGIEYMQGLTAQYHVPICSDVNLGACLSESRFVPITEGDLF